MNYYNEHAPFPAQWLRNLMDENLIPKGIVDERSIKDVQPEDLEGYTQCHFFAGIAGWPLALRLAGWDGPCWTGSCPCQPYSVSGKRKGNADERNLWPDFFRLIRECRPVTIFGEQVASPDALRWLDGVFDDLEGADYACGSADLCAAGVGAPFAGSRLYWMAKADCIRREGFIRRETNGEGRNSHSGSVGGPSASSAWEDSYRVETKRFPLEPRFHPLVNGFPGRVEQIRAYGNAIVPQVAAEFVRAYMELSQAINN
jgi:DNA (cytosine-5)-methyltransferase 1